MKYSRALIICMAVISVIIIIFIIDNYVPVLARKYYVYSYASCVTDNGADFEALVRKGTIKTIKEESWNSKPFATSKSLKSFLLRDKISVWGYGEYALLLHYAYQYANVKGDKEIKELIKNKFDKALISNGGGKIIRNDQVAYGNVAIDLYLDTHDVAYKKFADFMYLRLDSINEKEGIVKYREGSNEQHVDAIGLVCPFLYYYYSVFSIPHSAEIADKMTRDYIRYGTDEITGIPVQTYTINSHVKCNHADWGRGISLFLLGTRGMMSIDSITQRRLDILDSTLVSDEDRLYCHYFSQDDEVDMSATIPILYHLLDKRLISMSKDEFSKLVSPYFDDEGVIRYCSPSISYPHEQVTPYTTSLCFQGLSLFMFSLLDK